MDDLKKAQQLGRALTMVQEVRDALKAESASRALTRPPKCEKLLPVLKSYGQGIVRELGKKF